MGIFDAFSASDETAANNRAAASASGDITAASDKAFKKIKSGTKNAAPSFQQGVEAFTPYNQSGTGANKLLADITGVNGVQAQQAAQGLIATNPGYQYTLDQGLQGVLRNNAAVGGVASGNALTGLNDYAQNTAYNMNYLPWIQQLQGLSGQGIQGATGMANELNQLGNLYNTEGQNLANVALGKGTNLAGITMNTAAQNQAANNSADQNLWGAILGLGQAGAKAYGAA